MKRKFALAAFAALTIAASPCFAQGRGGGHGGGHAGHGVQTRTDARANSQGPAHASARARTRVNENSVLYGTTRPTTNLSGLTTGTNILANGNTLGTVVRVNRSNVLVRTTDGRVISLAPSSLTNNGGVWTTTRVSRGRR